MAGFAPDPLSASRERLRRLEQLRAEGFLKDDEYTSRRSAILDDVTGPSGASSSSVPSEHSGREAGRGTDPVQTVCPACDRAFGVFQAGESTCPACKWEFDVDDAGSVVDGWPIEATCPSCSERLNVRYAGDAECPECHHRFLVPPGGTPVATIVPPASARARSALRVEIQRRTRGGWHVVSESADGVQLRKPKHFSFGWAAFWFVVGLVGLLIPFIIYLLWHWAKKDRYVFLTLNADGSVTSSDRSLLGRLVAAYWRWGSSRSQPWQKALALAGPPAVVVLVVVALAVSGGSESSGTTNNAAASQGSGARAGGGAATTLSADQLIGELQQRGVQCSALVPGSAPVGQQAHCTTTAAPGVAYPVALVIFGSPHDFTSWKQTMDEIGCHAQVASLGAGSYSLHWVQVGDSNWVLDPDFRGADPGANQSVAQQLAAAVAGNVHTSGC